MARKSQMVFWHLLARLVGLTGALAVVIGYVVWREADEELGTHIMLAGGAAVALALLVELAGLVRLVASRRGAVGSNVVLQVLLAAALVAGVNLFSFFHYQRFDWTEKGEFTLDPKLRAELSRLNGETTIVVHRWEISFSPERQRKPDRYAAAADRKIIEKVRDLVEMFQELGPRFRVINLDIDDEDYQDKINAIAKESSSLGRAIHDAPENSIFFYSRTEPANKGDAPRENIQRLAFHDIYQLDKQASESANDQRGNLVLRFQGAEPFARKILNVEEKRPKIAVAVVHEYLSLESAVPMYTLNGVKKALEAQAFEGFDVILKHEWPRPKPSVLTFAEYRYIRIDAQVASLARSLENFQKAKEYYSAQQKGFEAPLAAVNKQYGLVPVNAGGLVVPRVLERTEIAEYLKKAPRLQVRDISEEFRQDYLSELKEDLEDIGVAMKSARERRDKLAQEKSKLNADDLTEKQRISDLKLKFKRMLADCDLLIVPRMTMLNVVDENQNIPYELHGLDDAQVDAVKEFMKAGKPVLFCVGPPLEPDDGTRDGLDQMLGELGIKLAPQTVFFDVDSDALAEQRANPGLRGTQTQIDVPAAVLDWPKGAGLMRAHAKYASGNTHPLRTSVRLGTRLGKQQALDLRLRHPRPVYAVNFYVPPDVVAGAVGVFAPTSAAAPGLAAALFAGRSIDKIDDSAFVLLSSPESWNEDQPIRNDNSIPRYERPKDDAKRGTPLERRRGPFPLAVAVEKKLPASWYPEGETNRPSVRLAVIGQGHVFTGENLSPAREKLLLDTCNWLLGRDDLLAKDTEPWQYPRVVLSDSEKALWGLGTTWGLPLLFVYLGTVMLLVRRMR